MKKKFMKSKTMLGIAIFVLIELYELYKAGTMNLETLQMLAVAYAGYGMRKAID